MNRAVHVDPVAHYIRGVYDEYMSKWHNGSDKSSSQSPPTLAVSHTQATSPATTQSTVSNVPTLTPLAALKISSLLNEDVVDGGPVKSLASDHDSTSLDLGNQTSYLTEASHGSRSGMLEDSLEEMIVLSPQSRTTAGRKRKAVNVEPEDTASSSSCSEPLTSPFNTSGSEFDMSEREAENTVTVKSAPPRRKFRCLACWNDGHFCTHDDAETMTLDRYMKQYRRKTRERASEPQHYLADKLTTQARETRHHRRSSHATAPPRGRLGQTRDKGQSSSLHLHKDRRPQRINAQDQDVDEALAEELECIKRSHERQAMEQIILATQAAERRKQDAIVRKCYYCWHYSQPCNPLLQPKCVPCQKNRRSCFGEYTRPEFCKAYLEKKGVPHKLAAIDDDSRSISRRSWPLLRKGHQSHVVKQKGSRRTKRPATKQAQRFFLDQGKLKCYRCWDRNLSCDLEMPKCGSCVKGRSACFGFKSSRKEFCQIFEQETGQKHKWAASFDATGPPATTHSRSPPKSKPTSPTSTNPSKRKRPHYVLSDTEDDSSLSEDQHSWDSDANNSEND